MTTAFVLSGGASLAAVQVGMLQALGERGIRPDLLVGTSAGAVNAAYVAGHGMGAGALDGLARLWTGLRRRTLFRVGMTQGARMLLGGHEALCSPEPLARLLGRNLAYDHLEDAETPVHVVATDVLTGQEVLLSRGPALGALLASCAIPGVLPNVERDGRMLCDGALADNSAISQALALGATTVYVLPGGTACGLQRPPGNPLSAAMHAITLLLQQRLVLETTLYAGAVDLRVLPPLCPLTISGANFSHAAELIARARRSSGEWLDAGADTLPAPQRFLSLHGHGPGHGRSAHGRSAHGRSEPGVRRGDGREVGQRSGVDASLAAGECSA